MKKIHTLIFFIFVTGILFTKTHTYYYDKDWNRAKSPVAGGRRTAASPWM